MRLVIANSYPMRAHGIIVDYYNHFVNFQIWSQDFNRVIMIRHDGYWVTSSV